MNYGIKIDLQKLKNAFLRNFTGKTATKRCICIPIDDNPEIFLGERGCYLNITANENQNSQYGDTHYLRGNIPTDVYEKLSEEERKNIPFLGNMRPIKPKQQTVNGITDINAPEDQKDEDLPF